MSVILAAVIAVASFVPPTIATGSGTWFYAAPHTAAAGPRLRRALGPHWRGRYVHVRHNGHVIRVRLTDWCRCSSTRIIDLSRWDFARLAPPSRGVIHVRVTR